MRWSGYRGGGQTGLHCNWLCRLGRDLTKLRSRLQMKVRKALLRPILIILFGIKWVACALFIREYNFCVRLKNTAYQSSAQSGPICTSPSSLTHSALSRNPANALETAFASYPEQHKNLLNSIFSAPIENNSLN